jgi:hypothetical protein
VLEGQVAGKKLIVCKNHHMAVSCGKDKLVIAATSRAQWWCLVLAC